MRSKQTKLPQILTAAAIMTMVSVVPTLAAGWETENGQWIYRDRNGNKVTDTWKKNDSGTAWFYLKDDGYMAVSQLVEDGDDYYYVNETGTMVKNEWRLLEDDSDNDAYTNGTCWYYLGSSGKAIRNTTGRTKLTAINGKKYAFDEEGRMLYGWVGEDAAMIDDESEWSSGLYYCGAEEDGAAVINRWQQIEVDDPEGDADADETYWFYFGTNGKKVSDTTKTINKKKYLFDDRGVAQFKWNYATSSDAASDSEASASNYKYYKHPEECWMATGWIYTVPEESVDPDAYNDDEEYWFYANKNGKLVESQIKTVDHYKYAFNEKGEMLEGLYALTFDENKKITSYREIETIDEMPDAEDGCSVYYFGNVPKDGVMASGKDVEIELDDKYTFGFRSNGEGIHGIYKNSIYIMGRKMKADSEMCLSIVTFEGEDYLVNTTGTIQKKKTNVRDTDDTYYCTDEKGIVTYQGSEKKAK